MLLFNLPNTSKSLYSIQLHIYYSFIKISTLKLNFKNHLCSELKANQCTLYSLLLLLPLHVRILSDTITLNNLTACTQKKHYKIFFKKVK